MRETRKIKMMIKILMMIKITMRMKTIDKYPIIHLLFNSMLGIRFNIKLRIF